MQLARTLLLVLVLTLLGSGLILAFQPIADFIVMYQTTILLSAVAVLALGVLVEHKQNSILRENRRLYRELKIKQEHMDRDMTMARNIQQGILHENIPRISGARITAECLPAREIGGDFYGIQEKDGDVYFFMGDVSGHGISSALVMSLTDGLVNQVIKQEKNIAAVMQIVNTTLCMYLHNNINFVTLYLARYRPKTRELTYVSAGHHPALLVRDDVVKPLVTRGTMLGIFANNTYTAQTIRLKPGDVTYVYTDGIIESRDALGAELTEEGFAEICRQVTGTGKTLLDNCLKPLAARKVTDDVSLLILECV